MKKTKTSKKFEDIIDPYLEAFNETTNVFDQIDITKTRSITFEIPGEPSLKITAWEDNGSIMFNLQTTGEKQADIRGLYFNLDADTTKLSISGEDVSDFKFGKVSNFKNGNNIKGEGRGDYDTGIDFGTSGIGKDDINNTTFTLSSVDEGLTLDIISHMEFASFMTSIGEVDSAREDGQKISTIAPAAPDAIDDSATTNEDTSITLDLVSNDTDADGDNLQITWVEDPAHGTVTIQNNQVIYTPDENWSSNVTSASDTFEYTVYDGNGGYDTATVTVDVKAIADASTLELSTQARENINEIDIVISSSLVDTDGSESYVLEFSDLPAGAILLDIDGNAITEIINPTSNETVTLILDEGRSHDFDFEVSAISSEANSDSVAVTKKSLDIVLDHKQSSKDITFEAINQSIWTTDEQFSFTDYQFFGIDKDDSGSGNVGPAIHYDYSYDFKLGLESKLELQGGGIDSYVPYDMDFTTNYNRTTDVLMLSTAAELLSGGSFVTTGPTLDYDFDFVFDAGLSANVDVDGLGNIMNIDDWSVDARAEIIDYHSGSSDPLEGKFEPYNITAILDWPTLEVDGSETALGTYEGSGESDNFLTAEFDFDVYNAFSIGIAGVHASFVHSYLYAGADFNQDFELQAGTLDASIIFENGESQDFTFGDDLIFENASALDDNNDGDVEFIFNLDVIDSTLLNDTNVGFNAGYTIDIAEVIFEADLWVTTIEETAGPLITFGHEYDLGEIDVFTDTIGVNYNDQDFALIA